MEKIKKYRADMALGRILAIYWVVLIQHNFAPYHPDWAWVGNGQYFIFDRVLDFTSYITLLTMPLCFFISGFILHKTGGLYKESNFLFFCINKVKRLYVPCVLFGSIFELIYNGKISWQCLIGFKHLWFISYLFLYFIVSYFLLRNMTILKIVGVILGTLVLRTLLKHYDLPVLGIMTYYIWFLLGILVAKKEYMFHKYDKFYFIGFCFFYLLKIFQIRMGGGTEKGDFLYEIFAVFSLLKILAIISNKIEKYKAFKLLDETSYGVYIFHMIFLYVFYCIFKNVIGEQYMIDNEVVLTSILAIFTVPFSIIATLLLQQTKILKL